MKNLKKLTFFLLICSLGLFPAHSLAGTQSKKTIETELICKDKIKLIGFPNILESIAHMRTVIQWSNKVKKKYDETFAQWHNAQSKSIKCKKEGSSQYFTCTLTAIPCAHKEVKLESETDKK
ncbi:MAG: hypothetical protein JJ964_06325 [Rhizobiales bacterium]|nr:hypothetical protein [Hyphomicrobiales bacterium]